MVDIRFYRDHDLDALADLLTDMSRYYNGTNASERAVVRRNLVENILGTDSDVRLVVAVEDRTVVGVAMVAILYPAPKEHAQLFMTELYVTSSRRSSGIGEALMRWVARYALSSNCVRFDWTVDADNRRAIDFYRSLGATHVADKLYFRFAGDALEAFADESSGAVETACSLAAALDADDFQTAASQLGPHTEYVTPRGTVVGRENIIESYRSASIWARTHLASVRYESRVRAAGTGLAIVTFVDHLEHRGRHHSYRCEQEVSVAADGGIVRIRHIDLPGEREALATFFQDVGIERPPSN